MSRSSEVRAVDGRQWNQIDAGKPPQTTTNHHKPLQTTTRIWDDGYSCAGKKTCIFMTFQWWFVVIWGGLPCRQTTTNHCRNTINNAEFGTMCIHVPVKSMPCLFCVMCNVSIITWCLDRCGHFHDVILNWHQIYSIGGATHTYTILIIAHTCQCFSM